MIQLECQPDKVPAQSFAMVKRWALNTQISGAVSEIHQSSV